jgi:energy-coupling factor transporter transmembrane protein EcfT
MGCRFFWSKRLEQTHALHPALQIILWCLLVALMQRLELLPLCGVAGVLLLLGGIFAGKKLLQLLRRTRWIMLSLLVIYAYSTPGQPLLEMLGAWSPVREGLADGAMQLLRLLAALSSLAILLDRLHRLALISGLYSLFAPLAWLGLSRERCAIRLALTLHYAEVAMLRSHARWQDALQGLFEPHDEVLQAIVLPLYRMGLRDVLAAILLGLCALGLILK